MHNGSVTQVKETILTGLNVLHKVRPLHCTLKNTPSLEQENHRKVTFYYLIFNIYLFICGTHYRVGFHFKRVLTDNPPSQGKIGDTTGVYVLYSFQIVGWCGFFCVPQEPDIK